ncbi:ComEC/Rec2 family competence protein [Pseudobacteroides cellulosolvens]|uniref:Beta-lactamase domain protein n=1 Tax=Pseudobacteroides cellulosolvens ATCC 35603 = DSM 2933 TaxID=398512 RepID=A0A0L6JPB3_9FIRM|nr:MBL fold metallo-hydrolase [Pseudobacteroides cellulosolvens]KNY27681.1 beta-lactamase domain protein [Pseudobacteroides cellulosolvens ATCC 35603 = DSM 2933]
MLEITIWDVQHGSSAYIKTPKDKHFVIDLGTGRHKNTQSEFSPLLYLKNNCITTIDQLVITHPHTDHIDDILNFDKVFTKCLVVPSHLTEEDIRKANPSSDSKKVEKYIEIIKRYCIEVNDADNPTKPENNGGVKFEWFVPNTCGRSNINNHSTVVVIEYLGVKVIIPGDNETASWKELLEKDFFIKAIEGANIFVASHHGRESGYYADLFNYFTPYLTIISDDHVTDTSITDKYSKIATGWEVYKRSDGSCQKRNCITTRSDGTINIKIWQQNMINYMGVSID